MDSIDKKQIILKRLKELIDLLNDVHDNSTNNLFPEDWIEVMAAISEIENDKGGSPDFLRRMNYLWRKNQTILKWRKDHKGSDMTYDEIVEWNVRDILINKSKISAIKYVREFHMKDNGEKLSLTEAKHIVDTYGDPNK